MYVYMCVYSKRCFLLHFIAHTHPKVVVDGHARAVRDGLQKVTAQAPEHLLGCFLGGEGNG